MVAHYRSVSLPMADLLESAITRKRRSARRQMLNTALLRDRLNKAKLASVHAKETTGI